MIKCFFRCLCSTPSDGAKRNRKGNKNCEATAIFSEILVTQRPAPKRSEPNVEGAEWNGGLSGGRG